MKNSEGNMSFKKIDIDTWDRKYYFDYFMRLENKMRCRVGITANVDITNLLSHIKSQELRCYPTFAYLISRVINSHNFFKISTYNGELVIWDKMHIRYPMFNEESKFLTSISSHRHKRISTKFTKIFIFLR